MGEWVYDPVSGGTFYVPDPGEGAPPGSTGGGGTPSPEPEPPPPPPEPTPPPPPPAPIPDSPAPGSGEWVTDPVSGGVFYVPAPGETPAPGSTGGGAGETTGPTEPPPSTSPPPPSEPPPPTPGGGEWVTDPVSGGTFYIPAPGETPPPGATGGGGSPTDTETPASPPPPPPPPPDEGWKPDFTQPDPWAGMPKDYDGVATFTPTPENPTPPWEGSQGATDAGMPTYGTPEYEQRAAEVATRALETFRRDDGSYDMVRIAEAGKAEFLRPLGVDEDVIRQAQAYVQANSVQQRALKDLEDFRRGAGIDVAGAVRAGKINSLKALGFTDKDIEAVESYLKNAEAYNTEREDFERTHIFIARDPEIANSRGQWITRESFEALPLGLQQALKEEGLSAFDTYAAGTAGEAVKLLPADVLEVYKDQGAADKFAILQAYGAIPPDAEYVKPDTQGNPMWKRGGGQTAAIVGMKDMYLVAADVLVPGVATVRHWSETNSGEKAFSIAMDAMSLIPVAGALGKGARASTSVTRAGRFSGALKGAGAELWAQTRAPVDVVLHPVQTVKGTVASARDLIENVAHIRKLPEAVITTTHGTVRLPVSKVRTEAEAASLRDRLMQLAIKGDNPVVEINGQRFELSRSALMKELGGGVAHTTPMGEAFEQGLKVTAKPGMPLSEQGLFVSHEPLPRFAKSGAFGGTGEKPTIFITSPETARNAISSQKLYRSAEGKVAEIEAKFPVNYELKAPAQRLFTRVGPEKMKVDILLENPLSLAQRAKLKSIAAIEDLKATFRPSLLIEGKRVIRTTDKIDEGLDAADAARLARALRASGNAAVAASFMRAYRAAEATARVRGDIVAVGSIRGRTPTRSWRDTITIRASGIPERTIGRADTTGPIIFRSQGGTALPGLVTARPPARPPGGTAPPRSPTPEPPRTGEPPKPPRDGPPPREPPGEPPRVPPERPPDGPPPDRPPRTPDDLPRIPGKLPSTPEPPRVRWDDVKRRPTDEVSERPPSLEFEPTKTRPTSAEIHASRVWPQGFGWWYVWRGSDGKLRRYFHPRQRPLPGTRYVPSGEREAYRGIQDPTGGGSLDARMPLGVVDVHLSDAKLTPGEVGAINFTPRLTVKNPRIPV